MYDLFISFFFIISAAEWLNPQTSDDDPTKKHQPESATSTCCSYHTLRNHFSVITFAAVFVMINAGLAAWGAYEGYQSIEDERHPVALCIARSTGGLRSLSSLPSYSSHSSTFPLPPLSCPPPPSPLLLLLFLPFLLLHPPPFLLLSFFSFFLLPPPLLLLPLFPPPLLILLILSFLSSNALSLFFLHTHTHISHTTHTLSPLSISLLFTFSCCFGCSLFHHVWT